MLKSTSFFLISLWVLASCSSSRDQTDAADGNTVVAQIGDYTLTLNEYERQFIKNNGGEEAASAATETEKEEFLDLLVKYRLKVMEAADRGFADDPAIQEELAEYRNSLAVPYLTERALIDPNVKKLYDRRREEIRVAHILIRPVQDTTGKVNAAATQRKIDAVQTALKSGESFELVAMKYSDDEMTREKGGDLNWFMAGMTVPAFDDAAYSLQPGQIYPEPVETMFGHHVIKLLDRKPTRGELQLSHILTRPPEEAPEDTAAAYAKIQMVLDSVKAGVSFEELARRHSEDPTSAETGGDLGWGGRRRFVPEFETAAYKLQPGETSGIVRTQFGYHIIKMTGERPPKSFEQARQELKDVYRRYGYATDNAIFVDSLRAEYNVKIHTATLDKMIPLLDTVSTTSKAGWYNNITDDIQAMPIVSMTGKTMDVAEMIKTIERTNELQSTSVRRTSFENVILKKIADDMALNRATENLETRYPEFADLMREYREGVLLFRAEQDAVWNKVNVDSVSLRKYWEDHKAEYTWPDRVRFHEIFVTSDSIAAVIADSLDAGVAFDALASRHTQRTGYKAKNGDWGFQPADANDLSERAMNMAPGAVEGPFKFQYGHSFIQMAAKDPARTKTFDEAYSEVSSKFQEYESKRLEREWIEHLREKYGVKVRKDVVKNAFSDASYTNN